VDILEKSFGSSFEFIVLFSIFGVSWEFSMVEWPVEICQPLGWLGFHFLRQKGDRTAVLSSPSRSA
jgi:hypothetical protein